MDKNIKNIIKNIIPDMHQKLTDSVVAMLSTGKLPYYGEFALFMNFYESKNNPQIPTAGVNVTNAGMNFYWDRGFMNRLSPSETNFLLIHEEFHLLFDHIKRSIGYDQRMSNIAQDMIINQIIYDEIMIGQKLSEGKKPFITIPKDHLKNNSALFIPKEYKGEPIFEELFDWLINEQKKWRKKNSKEIKKMNNSANKCPKCGSSNKPGNGGKGDDKCDGKCDGNGKGEGGDGSPGNESGNGSPGNESPDGDGQNNTCPNCGHKKTAKEEKESRNGETDSNGNPKYGKHGKNDVECYSKETIFEGEERNEQNTLDVHITDEVPPEMKREVVEGVMQTLKSRGLQAGEIETILNKLRKTHTDYLKEIKRTMSNHVFGTKKQKTIVRPNRRGIKGLKGHKKYRTEINCILDTSGSMGGEFEKVLSYIFQNDIEINLIQIDAQIQGVIKIKDKKQLEKMKIRGLGGTTLTPAIDFIGEPKNKIHKNNTVILTDGWTDSLNFKNIKTQTLILSTASKCPISHDNGKIKQIENIGKQDD